MEQICAKIMENFEGDLKLWHSDDNSTNLVILARGIQTGDKDEEVDEDGGRLEEDLFLRRIEHYMLNDLSLCGVKGIRRAFISEEKRTMIDENGSYKDERGWFLETEGINLVEVLSHHGVDHTRTVSNSIVEIMEVLGIEATRFSLPIYL